MYLHKSAVSSESNDTSIYSGRLISLLLLLVCFAVTLTSCSAPRPLPAPVEEPEEEYVYHRIKYSGETVAIISAWYTKSAKNWPEIVDANPKMVPSKLKIGDFVKIPKRLMRRDSSLPQNFITSFKSGVNKDTSKSGELSAAPESNEKPSEDAGLRNSEPRRKVSAGDSSDFTVPDSVEERTPEQKTESKADQAINTESPETAVAADNKADSDPGTPAANDENQKIREQLMQELLQ